MNHYTELSSIDVSKFVEKKGKLDYLSWPIAVDFLMKADPAATWEFHEPQSFSDTLMVSCTVTAFGKPMTMHLPVMDHSSKAIKNPDAFQVNKNMMRCLVKAIACHGLGISVYAGEDLPENAPKTELREQIIQNLIASIENSGDLDELKKNFAKAFAATQHDVEGNKLVTEAKDKRKLALAGGADNSVNVPGAAFLDA